MSFALARPSSRRALASGLADRIRCRIAERQQHAPCPFLVSLSQLLQRLTKRLHPEILPALRALDAVHERCQINQLVPCVHEIEIKNFASCHKQFMLLESYPSLPRLQIRFLSHSSPSVVAPPSTSPRAPPPSPARLRVHCDRRTRTFSRPDIPGNSSSTTTAPETTAPTGPPLPRETAPVSLCVARSTADHSPAATPAAKVSRADPISSAAPQILPAHPAFPAHADAETASTIYKYLVPAGVSCLACARQSISRRRFPISMVASRTQPPESIPPPLIQTRRSP